MDGRFRRRELLSRTGVAVGAIGLAGCNGPGLDSKFRVSSHRVSPPAGSLGDAYLVSDLVDVDAEFSIGYSERYKQSLADELFETGSVTTINWPLAARREFGPTTRVDPTFVVHDRDYYRIRLEETESVDREWWEFYVEWVDADPGEDDVVITDPSAEFFPPDSEIVETALDRVYADRDPPLRHDDAPFGSRGVLFHHRLHPDKSELVPSPPFDYVERRNNYFRPVAQRGTVSVTRSTFSLERVASSTGAFEEYAREALPDARFDDVALSSDAVDVLDEATSSSDGRSYEEEPPLSDALETVLDHLGIARHVEPHDAYDELTTFHDAIAEYEAAWYEFDLAIYP